MSPTEDAFSEVRAFEAGKYRTLARLGQGGMAEVFLAVARGPVGFNKLLVIKRLKPELLVSADHRAMFLDEARLAARLSHPNVVQTYEITEDGECFLITMEYLDGQPLSALMKKTERAQKRLSNAVYAHVCAEALAGLHYAHELLDYDGTPLKIVHRDVSPQNIFLTYDGQVKIVDFGVAKAEVSSNKTQAGVLKGKVAYMAPEQLAGDADCRSDVFTMGIVLWELLTGKRLMAAGSATKTLMRVLNEKLQTPSEAGAPADPVLDAIVMRALQRDSDLRFQNANEMREALAAYVASSGVSVGKEDIAKSLTEHFGDVRTLTQTRIREKMAGVQATSSGTMRAVRLDQSSGGMRASTPGLELTGAPTSVWSVPNLEAGSVITTMPPPISSASVVIVAPEVAVRRGRAAPVLIALAIVGAAFGGFLVRERGGTHAPAVVVAPPPASVEPTFASASARPPDTAALVVAAPSALDPAPRASVAPSAPETVKAASPSPSRSNWQRPSRPAAAAHEASSTPAAPSLSEAAPTAAAATPPPPAAAAAAPASPASQTSPASTGRRIRTEY